MYERKEIGEEKEHHGIHEEGRTAMNFRRLIAYIVVDSTEKQSDDYVSGQPELGQVLESNKIVMVLEIRSFKMISALICIGLMSSPRSLYVQWDVLEISTMKLTTSNSS